MAGPVERDDAGTNKPLLVTVMEGSGGGDDCLVGPAASSSSIAAVVTSTAVAVAGFAGSFEFGISYVGYSSPSQPGIMRDLNLSIVEAYTLLSVKARFGHPGAFVEALQKLRGKGTDIYEEAEEIKDFTEKLQCLPIQDVGPVSGLHSCRYSWNRPNGPSTVNAICFYASEIFVSAGFSSGNAGMLVMAAVQVSS